MKLQWDNLFKAFRHGGEKYMMAIHRQEDQDGDEILKLRYQRHLAAGHGIDYIGYGKAHLEPDQFPCKLDSCKDKAGHKTDDGSNEDFTEHADNHGNKFQRLGGEMNFYRGKQHNCKEKGQPSFDNDWNGPVASKDRHDDNH